ncbi:MBL fold metallo-hydrolase [Leeuwenhoekiella marinoflava]|uniref:MBL fold metallo-hydrolase n=1 Tax=Leeuwenhoekiella marinoflava TaxID=988 RepID=UPI0030034164
MTVIPIPEGLFTVDKTKEFVPIIKLSGEIFEKPEGSIVIEIQPFIILTNKDIILIDTGIGNTVDNELQLHKTLLSFDIHPSQITKVLLSHLHKDHTGGITKQNEEGENVLAFENAKYYIQQKEYEYAMDMGSPHYIKDQLNVLYNNPNVVWLNGNGLIDNYINFELTSGHSKYHQVFYIKEEGEIIFFGGDDAPQFKQMNIQFVAYYDYDGKKCRDLRKFWKERGQREHWKFLFYHDLKTPSVIL